jgi:hypothetical protein
MANGILGQSDVAATTNTTVYTVPADTFSVVTLNVVNRSTAPRTVRVALSASGTPGNSEWIEYDVEILANGVLERTGLVLDATKNIVVYADSLGCTACVYGIETATS